MAQGYYTLVVVDSSALLRVDLQGPRKLKPGEAYRGKLVIRDAAGRAVKARFSAALVDEAIFAVAKRSIHGQGNAYGMPFGDPADAENPGLLSIFSAYYYYRNNQVISQIDRVVGEDLWHLQEAGRRRDA